MVEDVIITLTGIKLAKVGNEFIFRGGTSDCEDCKLNKTCLNLNSGSKYKVVNIRTGGKLECFIHESGVCAVEVVETPIVMAVESRKAIKGSKIVHEQTCNILDCDNYELCLPFGIKNKDKLTIINVIGDVPEECKKNYSLKITEVKR